MRALLNGLHESATAMRRPALEGQLARLDAAVSAAYPDAVERAHAELPDRIGIGGARR